MSEKEFSGSDEMTGLFRPISGFKNVYIGRQSLNLNTTRRQQIINIQQCLMNQVDDQIDKLDEQFPDSLLRPTQINAQNFAKIDELVTLPYFNMEYVQFMPPVLENQFNFRFNRYSEPYFAPDWAVHPELRVAVFSYTKNARGGSGTKDKQPVKQDVQMEYMSTSQSLGVLFKKVRGSAKIRGLSLRPTPAKNEVQTRSNIILLHDFFQNPLSLIPVMNYFAEQQLNVYVPYIADLTALVKGAQTDEMVKTMVDALYWAIKAELGFGIKYQVCAQGTSAILGLTLQDIDLECLKTIIMNPIMRFRIKKPRGTAATAQAGAQNAGGTGLAGGGGNKHDMQVSDLQSGSIISTSHSSLRDAKNTPLEPSKSDSDDTEIKTASTRPNAVEITFKKRANARKMPSNTADLPPLDPNSKNDKPDTKALPSSKLYAHTFQAGTDLTVTSTVAGMPSVNDAKTKQEQIAQQQQITKALNRTALSMSQRLNEPAQSQGPLSKVKKIVDDETLTSQETTEANGDLELFDMVNDCLRAVYHDLEILQTILNILGVKKIKDLRPFRNLEECIQIKTGFTFESSMRQRFVSGLLGLLVFDPLEAFVGYNAYKETFDSFFFEMMSEMEFYIDPQTYDFDGPQNVMFLLGSNACMVTKQQMVDILTVTEYYITVEARTVLGAGQDLFFSGIVLLEKILKANG